MIWLRDILDPPEKLREIRQSETQHRDGQVAAPRAGLNWRAVCLGAALKAGLMAAWSAGIAMLVQSLEEPTPWLLYACVVTMPGFVVGVVARSDHFMHGFLGAVVGSLLGTVAMIVAGIAALPPPPPGASVDYGQGLGVGIAIASMLAVMLGPVAGVFSAIVDQQRRRSS